MENGKSRAWGLWVFPSLSHSIHDCWVPWRSEFINTSNSDNFWWQIVMKNCSWNCDGKWWGWNWWRWWNCGLTNKSFEISIFYWLSIFKSFLASEFKIRTWKLQILTMQVQQNYYLNLKVTRKCRNLRYFQINDRLGKEFYLENPIQFPTKKIVN